MSAPESHQGIILVADDNEANRELLSAVLSAEGYQVVCAADGHQALARVNSDSPVNKHELLARVHSLLRLKQFTDELDNAETVLFSLALSIEAKDPYTEGHCDRLSKYSVALGEKL